MQNMFQFDIVKNLLWESLKLLSCFNGFDLETNPVFTCTKPLDKTSFDTLRLSTIQPSLAADMVELMIFTLLLCSKKPESSKDASSQADAQEPSWIWCQRRAQIWSDTDDFYSIGIACLACDFGRRLRMMQSALVQDFQDFQGVHRFNTRRFAWGAEVSDYHKNVENRTAWTGFVFYFFLWVIRRYT